MRILVLTPTFLPALGGAELVILQVFRRLAVKHSVLVITPYLSEKLLSEWGSREYDFLINFDVRRYYDRYTLMKIRGHRLTGGLIPPFSLSAVSAMQQAVEDFKPDVINVHYVMPTGFAGLYAQKALKVPTVITYNGRDVPGPGVPPLWKYWHKLIGLNCRDMTFVSKYCREVIYGPSSQIGHIIYNGVEEVVSVSESRLKALRSKLRLENETFILLALQRLDYLKRVDVIIKAMPKILVDKPQTRLIIGGKGPDLDRLKKLAEDLHLADRVIFAGFIPDDEMPIYYALADLFVFHSTYETFGMVLAEAMNHGKAIVSVANTAIQEVLDAEKTGLLVPTLDHNAMAKAVLQLLNNRFRREEMGKQGKMKVESSFKWDTIALEYERVFSRMLHE